MKVWIKGQSNPIELTQSNYVAGGGEGDVYVKGIVGFKIYHDPTKMIPLGKIQELAVLSDPRINKPQTPLVDAKGKPIGYTMQFYKDCWALCQLFPRDFRNRNGITHDMSGHLVMKMREGIDAVHKTGILIVDLNELNFLVTKRFDDVRFIDVDSWQTPRHPATAIMSSIRDWRNQASPFSPESDWWSFGIVSFQMFIGMHPFKGRYKGPEDKFKTKLPTDDPADDFAVTRRRMEAGVSVFRKDVGVPAAAYPFDVIPPSWRAWYEALFEKGVRCAPPLDFGAPFIIIPKTVTVAGTDKLDISEMFEMDGNILGMWSDGTRLVIATPKGVFVDRHRFADTPKTPVVAFSPRSGHPILMDGTGSDSGFPTTNLDTSTGSQIGMAFSEMACTDGRAYVRATDQVHEVILTDAGNQVIPSTKETVRILEHATKLFPGVVIQKMLGATYVSLLVESGKAIQVRMKDLDGHKIVDAKLDKGVLMVIGVKRGQYDRFVFRFAPDDTYDVRVIKDVATHDLNFVTLDSGVCVCINEEEDLEVFSARKDSQTMKVIQDPIIAGDMKLGKHAGSVVFAKGNKVFKMRMK
jgi:hypothetical protein